MLIIKLEKNHMSELKLFQIGNEVKELKSGCTTIERELQNIIEKNMYEFFAVRFLQSEYRIDNGRMDSIGIDENYCPVIFEYKCHSNENVINQGLFYLNWLLEHKANFKLLVIEKLGIKEADKIDWSMPRVICIASDFNKYDEEAIKQINRNVSLIRYKKYDNNLLLFELLNSNTVAPLEVEKEPISKKQIDKTFIEQYDNAPKNMKNIFDELKDYALSLGDDVSENTLKLYVALKKIKTFATMEIYQSKILVNFKLLPENYSLNEYLRDIRNIGHWGCGDLQIIIKSNKEIELAKSLLKDAYEEN
jgi:predicted transport protein